MVIKPILYLSYIISAGRRRDKAHEEGGQGHVSSAALLRGSGGLTGRDSTLSAANPWLNECAPMQGAKAWNQHGRAPKSNQSIPHF